MNIITIEENVKQLITTLQSNELDHKSFIYQLLLAYGHRPQSVGRVRSGERNLAEDKENSVFWKRQLYFKIGKSENLYDLIDQMSHEKRTEANKIRFVIVTDFQKILAIDTKTKDTLDIDLAELPKKFDFFLPWANIEKAVYQGENPADVKAAEKIAKLFDEIKADNFSEDELNNKENLHQLNIFLSRLLFCYFAEDTGIFKDKQFTSAISRTLDDGSDLAALIKRLFDVLNQSTSDRASDLPDFLSDFPYVNGGLFRDDIQLPTFTRKSRRILIECGAELDWSDINPDIFGSMFQAVVHTEQRSNMGQHYTSVPNIMKVIEPLFLNDLYEELEKNENSIPKLMELQLRLEKIKIFDPACGSGNFLIIAYKELRKFEMELLKRIQELELEKTGQFSKPFSLLQVSQFYGIEIDDFACEIAILSLWLTEHQMNMQFKDEFGESLPTLPLKVGGNIINGNAIDLDWQQICPSGNTDIVFVLGNPPYKGFSQQTISQKDDLYRLLGKTTKLDYISCWFIKSAQYIQGSLSRCAFVSTNSLAQGEQVALLWAHLRKFNVGIYFAHKDFKWSNSAKSNAGVTCIIIGLTDEKHMPLIRKIYDNNHVVSGEFISPYLNFLNVPTVEKRTKVLSKLPKMVLGNMPNDWGYLHFSTEEREELVEQYPQINKFIKKVVGSNEFIKGLDRWCLWISEDDLVHIQNIPLIQERLNLVALERAKSKKKSYQQYADKPYRFIEIRHQNGPVLIIPGTSSERRLYIPIGFSDDSIIINNLAFAIYNPEPYIFSILTSKMHMLWVRAVGGSLETRLRYSSVLCYNTFPFPEINSQLKEELTNSTFNILSIRESYINVPMSELYDPDTMPNDLLMAHKSNDLIVDRCYSKNGFESNEDRLQTLFNLYNEML